MADHRVRPGDCFASIAKENNFFNYRTLYDHGDNAALKGVRPNPNQLIEGDVVKVPAKRQKTVNLVLDGTKGFVVDRKKTRLRLVVTDARKNALAPSSCELKVGGARSTSLPGAQGMIELEIDAEEHDGTLKMSFPALPAPGAAAADPAQPNPPANPPVIQPGKFIDKLPKAPIEALEATVDLEIGALEPKEAVRGSFQRLANLTYDVPVRTDENDKTRKYVKGYQAFTGVAAPRSGNVADIRDNLATLHDNP